VGHFPLGRRTEIRGTQTKYVYAWHATGSLPHASLMYVAVLVTTRAGVEPEAVVLFIITISFAKASTIIHVPV